ncbi:MAG: hypothetical protein P8168_09610 [Deltaproteobacteria bacterium]
MAQCAACRRELTEYKEVITAIHGTPAEEPGEEFWREFSRDMHLKLAQVAQDGQKAPVRATPRWLRLSYILGAPALAVLLLWVAVQYMGPGSPISHQILSKKRVAATRMAAPEKKPATQIARVPAPVGCLEQFVPVALVKGATFPAEEVDISGWDLDSELAGMTDQEKEIFLKRLHQRAKDGSCVEKYSWHSWA